MFKPFASFSRRSNRRWLYPFVSLMVALGLVVGSPRPGQAAWWDIIVPGVQAIQLSRLSDEQEVQLGQEINQQLLGEQVRLYRNREVNEYVDEVGQRLAAASDRPNIPYTFQVVQDDSINAFATMGGFVYVHTGLLKAADNEAELASVLAHEIGHIANKHVIRSMRRALVTRGLASAAGLDRSVLVGLGVELALNRPKSRGFENEADRVGLHTLIEAGYAPSGMISFFEKLLDQPSIPTFLSDHPATTDRIAALQREINPATANNGDGLDEAAYKEKMEPLLD